MLRWRRERPGTGGRRGAPRVGLVGLVVLLVGTVAAACGNATPGTSTGADVAAPATTASCAQVASQPPAQASGATAPVAVTRADGGRLVLAWVCAGRRGPYPFVVGTGSSRSLIDTALASALGLKGTGSVPLGGSGCATTGALVHVPALRLGPIALESQDMVRTALSDWAGRRVDGVLGSDVWGRFGALRLDLTARTLSVATPEGPGPAGHAVVENKTAVPPPASVALGTTAHSAPLNLVLAPGSVAPFVSASTAGHGPYAFAVDTGTPTSFLSSTVGFADHLPDQGTAATPPGVGCQGTVHTLAPVTLGLAPSATGTPAPWSAPVAFRAVGVPGPLRQGMVGSLGLDLLGADGALVLDYAGATLSTGTGSSPG